MRFLTTYFSSLILAAVAVSAALVQAPPKCGNEGLQWAVWNDAYPNTLEGDKTFDPTTHKKEAPVSSGQTAYLHYSTADGGSVYKTKLATQNIDLMHRGYLYAPENGTYTLSVTHVDNNFIMWIGAFAFIGWNRGNARQDVIYAPNAEWTGARGTYTTSLVAGKYIQFRALYRNGGGVGNFDYTITSPSGYVLIDSAATAVITPYVVQYSCDSAAPKYPPWGQEF